MINSRLVLQKGAVEMVAQEFGKQFPGKKPIVVADTNTWSVCGKRVAAQFPECGYFIFDGDEVYADDKHVDVVCGLLEKDADLTAVAVGSGTLNDLCKRASFVCGKRPYMCVATAPSVDGFTSNGAAITDHGLKVTLPCPAPVLVMADPEVLRNAPLGMISSGYGDLAAKVPAGADWLIADCLGVEKVDKNVWDIVQPKLRDQIGEPEQLHNRDGEAIARVFDGLIHTGFAMQEYFDSRPASGADHLMSHVWEMNECCMVGGKAASHGFKVAIGTLASTASMGELLKMSSSDVRKWIETSHHETWDERVASISEAVSIPSVRERQIEICRKKFQEGKALEERQHDIVDKWEEIKRRIKGQILPFDEMRRRFSLAGCPVEPSDIGLSLSDFKYGMRVAQIMRNRYTNLDLLYEIGMLSHMVDVVSGYFHSYRG